MRHLKKLVFLASILAFGTAFAAAPIKLTAGDPSFSGNYGPASMASPYSIPVQLEQGVVAHFQISNRNPITPDNASVIVEWNGQQVCGGPIAVGGQCIFSENGNGNLNQLTFVAAPGSTDSANGVYSVSIDPFK